MNNANAIGFFDLIEFHRILLSDRVRNNFFMDACYQIIGKGDCVLDVGCGTGILSMMAAINKAKMVVGVDNSKIADIAENVIKFNNFSDIIKVANCDIFNVKLEQKFDVIIAELMGTGLLEEKMVEITRFCKLNFLKDGGKFIPNCAKIYAVPISASLLYKKCIGKINSIKPFEYSINWEPWLNCLLQTTCSRVIRGLLSTENFIEMSKPQLIKKIIFGEDKTSLFSSDVSFDISIPDAEHEHNFIHFFHIFFEVEISNECKLSTYCRNPITSWGHGLIMLAPPHKVCDKEMIKSTISYNPRDKTWSLAIGSHTNNS